jgi:hypothetical protein
MDSTVARTATVSLRVLGKAGVTLRNLQSTDFTLIVNGTPRFGRLQAPGASSVPVVPLVLLVFPPNQPVVHSIGIHAAEKYFHNSREFAFAWIMLAEIFTLLNQS